MVRTPALALATLLGALALTGCGDDTDAGATPGTDTVESADPTPVSSETCDQLVDDEVVTALGWTPGGTAGESVGRCEWSGGGDVLTVGERQDLAAGYDEDSRTAYREACSGLEQESGGVLDEETTWLGETEACLLELEEGSETGVARMYVLTDDLALVEVQVVASTPTPVESLRAGLTMLTERVEQTW
ncbi:hypothetical protein [Nocardioides dongkuii]|uniref:hypothetical protein n=1 Tax=Nocardioides dongkuii TaxID=2760089 RepID=UPI0015F96DAF|nr:hypothetical protein [Nocardioides dongkuii]